MVHGAALAVGTHGASAASLRDLASEAGVPLGSLYHHFPGGKRQLVEEAVGSVGDRIERLIEKSRDRGLDATLAAFSDNWRAVLEETGFRGGCPVMAVALEDDKELNALAESIFARWQESLTQVMRDGGVAPRRAPRLARIVVASIEGAIALCRAEHSTAPLDDTLDELRALFVSCAS